MSLRLRLAFTLALALGVALPATASAHVLSQNALSRLDRATRVGAAPANQKLTIGVSLARPDDAGETALLARQFDRSSPDYHRWLTPSQFAARFGVPAPTMQAARDWL